MCFRELGGVGTMASPVTSQDSEINLNDEGRVSDECVKC